MSKLLTDNSPKLYKIAWKPPTPSYFLNELTGYIPMYCAKYLFFAFVFFFCLYTPVIQIKKYKYKKNEIKKTIKIGTFCTKIFK